MLGKNEKGACARLVFEIAFTVKFLQLCILQLTIPAYLSISLQVTSVRKSNGEE